jgi:Flp pilus assembly protein TadG
MGLIRRLSRSAAAFAADRRGNYAMMFGIAAATLMLGAGYALNTGQLVSARSNLLAALDAAVTSTARDLTTGVIDEAEARASVEAFLLANGARAFADADRIVLGNLVVDRETGTVSASATVEVDLAFPLFGNSPSRIVGVDSAAVYSDRRIEVAMMLDVTGSMSGQKIRDLRDAAKGAIDIFLAGQAADNPRIRVSLVPYADAVNTGDLAHVVYQEAGRSSPSEPPALDEPVAASGGFADRCSTEREGTHQFDDAPPSVARVNRDYRLNFCPQAALMPLSADANALKARVDAFRAEGHTAGQIGIQWSWYMLSPRWAEVLPAAARPAPHDPKSVAKIAILMTDGEFNTAYADVAHGSNVRSQSTKSRNYAEELCARMRRDGIEVFTVGFMLREANARAVMRACASPDSGSVRHYYDASTGAELVDAYRQIARNIERLALTR